MLKSRLALAAILVLYAVMAAVGITWGLPTSRNDRYLFGDEPPWPGEKIARLANASRKESTTRGADVDADPLDLTRSGPIDLTATEEDVAAIYLRYRLYTHQPDEMITMMALAGMKPRQLQFDPKLYQYDGLFIYPVAAAIALAGKLGLIHVTSDITWYLDHPDEFGKFYIVARAYVALWGAVGVILAYAVASRLALACSATPRSNPQSAPFDKLRDRLVSPSNHRNPQLSASSQLSSQSSVLSPCLAALLFALMPITVCMSHEAKPHLPGAVLMLAAVWFAMKHVQNSEFRIQNSKKGRHDWHCLCMSCGAAFGMVLSALPIFVLIPLAEWLRSRALRFEISNPKSQIPDSPPTAGLSATASAPPASPQFDSIRNPLVSAKARAGAGQSEIRNPPSFRIPHSAFRILMGSALAFAVYLVTNPYVPINALTNREVLLSNLRNSTAMYEIGRVGQGLLRALELIAEGASPILLVSGVASLALLAIWRLVPRCRRIRGWHGSAEADPWLPATRRLIAGGPLDSRLLPLIVPAAVFFVQFALLAAAKPAEYGRFGVFIDAALAIATAAAFGGIAQRVPRRLLIVPLVCLIATVGYFGWAYVHNFRQDAGTDHTRAQLAALLSRAPLAEVASPAHPPVPKGGQGGVNPQSAIRNPQSSLSPQSSVLSTLSDPAPYNCPPMNFTQVKLWRYPSLEAYLADPRGLLLRPVDGNRAKLINDGWWQITSVGNTPPYSPISWANKPFILARVPHPGS